MGNFFAVEKQKFFIVEAHKSNYMDQAVFQSLILLATFDIALVTITIANFAVSVSFLGRETRLSRKRMERRRQIFSETLKKLQMQTLKIENIKKEIKEVEKDIDVLSTRIFLLSWSGAVILPASFFIGSLIVAVLGINIDILFPPPNQYVGVTGFIAISLGFIVAGFLMLLIVISAIDSAARRIPTPEFEVYFPDLTKTAKIKCKTSATIRICINNKGEDMGENERVFVNFPPAFKIFESLGAYRIFEQGEDTDHPHFTAVIFTIDFHHIDNVFNTSIQLMPPDEKKPFQIPVDIYEKKSEKTKLELTIEVID